MSEITTAYSGDTPVKMTVAEVPHITEASAALVREALLNRTSFTKLAEQWEAQRESRAKIFDDISIERSRQNMKFTDSYAGTQHHNIFVWKVILGEEVGEVDEAILDYFFDTDPDKATKLIAHLREEMIQVAAVAVAIVERIDANDPALLQPEPNPRTK